MGVSLIRKPRSRRDKKAKEVSGSIMCKIELKGGDYYDSYYRLHQRFKAVSRNLDKHLDLNLVEVGLLYIYVDKGELDYIKSYEYEIGKISVYKKP